MLAAVLHITVTGNFLFALATSMLLWNDRREYLNTGARKLGSRQFAFSTSAHLVEKRVDRHYLHQKQDTSGTDPTWVLETTGMLMDSQLGALVNSQQETEACRAVALAALELQLRILQAEPQYESQAVP